ncbi:DNA-binding response regulator, NarL/FixJ family, contains REC and HTH domains [Amycolatopsis xylanica]|uniref:DNA-binding response regulator, NarL/FixJ family, contains REC and HTH domains n=1 Tax=Amycolatopsis xylanica TaxID=589385 RepID=A0A1H2SYT5_9PSEU|nr:response regulator [Amycolatopsis xylanica]SDW36184.1 DNA-binding response regulator, NarL/FixJ family, contains REC and HTH domains [Amycolatopsis xylanica]
MTGVLVVDDHPLISTALVVALTAQGIDARRIPVDDSILRAVGRHEPGLVLLDLDLGENAPSGLRLIEPLRAGGWAVLIVTACRDRTSIAEAVALGALGWVSKAESFERLLAVIVDAAAGREVLSRAARAELILLHQAFQDERRLLVQRLGRLSARERQVLDRLAAGRSAAAVAAEFTVSLATVRAQIRSILTKLDVRSQLAAVAIAHEAQQAGLPQF